MTVGSVPAPAVYGPAESWAKLARCRGVDVFYVGDDLRGEAQRRAYGRAKRVCRDCPVIADCLAYALDTRQPAGVWGGLDPDERRVAAAACAWLVASGPSG